MWLQSISYTDWLNSVVTSDSLGELILAVLPQICYTPQYIKRTLERRFVSTQHTTRADANQVPQTHTGNVTTSILRCSCDEEPTVTCFLPCSARLLHVAGAPRCKQRREGRRRRRRRWGGGRRHCRRTERRRGGREQQRGGGEGSSPAVPDLQRRSEEVLPAAVRQQHGGCTLTRLRSSHACHALSNCRVT